MKPIDLLESPILPGPNLIEASAGTGKTQTIAGLFLRLLLEVTEEGRPLQVDQILVLTYTDAATEELRERIRSMLVQALHAFERGQSADPFLRGLIQRHAGERDQVIGRLRLSANCFDLAPIFTIHGFCQRALKDRAFESSSLFDTELLTDQSALMQEIADDFWRRNFYAASPLRLAFALRAGLSAGSFLPLLKSCISHPSLQFVSRSAEEAGMIAIRMEHTFVQLRELWRRESGQAGLRACFGSRRKWGNNPYNDDAKMAPLFAALDRVFAGAEILPKDLGSLRQFSAAEMRSRVTKLKRGAADPVPEHPFCEQCERLFIDADDHTVALRKLFFQEAQRELRLRKEQLKVLSYDDLLMRLREALGEAGETDLAMLLRRRYRAALIDEFQDTDPIQAGIFQRIFLPSPADGREEPHRLFLIGDPKQAIYGFRGADVFSYLQVAKQAEHRYTLGRNWRSDSSLVQAVNTFFGAGSQAFVVAGIEFEEVTPQGRADEVPLRINGAKQAPLQLWFYPRDREKSGEIPRKEAEAILPQAVAAEISRLLRGNNHIGDRPLRPQDFAVLVMTHHQAHVMQEALGLLGIPSVQQTQETVFASEEAIELLRVLTAVAHPSFEPAIRAALATRLWGVSGTEIHRLHGDEPGWQRYLEQHRRYFEEWSGRGFAAMFRLWATESGLRERLLAGPGGERALTNTLHLGELLQQIALTEKLGPSALLKWFAARAGSAEAAADEYQLRLERDENAVQIVTVHKSKGLQYEIVFVPFCWRESEPGRGGRLTEDAEIFFHDEQAGTLMRDLGPTFRPEHVRLASKERLAEQVRLLYVALTRARHRCYFAWGAFKFAGSSAPAWVLHPARGTFGQEQKATGLEESPWYWSLDFGAVSDEELRADLEARAAISVDQTGRPTMVVSDVPQEAGERYQTLEETAAESLRCREFSRTIETDWRVASFSWMTSGHRLDRVERTEEPDRDSDELNPVDGPGAARDLFGFPRGSKAGTCLHAILEQFELTDPDPRRLEDLVARQLRVHGVDAAFGPAVVLAIQRTLAASLDDDTAAIRAGDEDAKMRSGFCLNRIRSRLVELEFCFALRPLDRGALGRIFADLRLPAWAAAWPERIGQLMFSPMRGFMKGFIDLVCEHEGRYYLIDWKSNWLGNRLADYHPAAIQREMVSRFYLLQYHLYAVALHRHLQLRLPGYSYERHFGGVRYLFLRGIDPAAPGHGIFGDRPDATQIAHLTETLLAAPVNSSREVFKP
jgi:exodeoxyribonuclease V beta subunit